MRADGRTADGVSADSVLIQQVEHRVPREKSSLRIESRGLAVEIVVALLPGRELHFPPHDRLPLQQDLESLFVLTLFVLIERGHHVSVLYPVSSSANLFKAYLKKFR